MRKIAPHFQIPREISATQFIRLFFVGSLSSIMLFSVDDELTWRATPENLVREMEEGMDWERCAALHNLVLRLGWVASEKLESPRQT